MPDTTPHTITAGQVYVSCDPRDSIRLRVTTYSVGALRAHVADASSGKRPRQILTASLHASALGPNGKRRRTGYCLATPTNRETLRA